LAFAVIQYFGLPKIVVHPLANRPRCKGVLVSTSSAMHQLYRSEATSVLGWPDDDLMTDAWSAHEFLQQKEVGHFGSVGWGGFASTGEANGSRTDPELITVEGRLVAADRTPLGVYR